MLSRYYSFSEKNITIIYMLGIAGVFLNPVIGLVILSLLLVISSDEESILIYVSSILFEPFLPEVLGNTSVLILSAIFIIRFVWKLSVKIDFIQTSYIAFVFLYATRHIVDTFIYDVGFFEVFPTLVKMGIGLMIYNILNYKKIDLDKLIVIAKRYAPYLLIIATIMVFIFSNTNSPTYQFHRYKLDFTKAGLYGAIVGWFLGITVTEIVRSKSMHKISISIIATITSFTAISFLGTRSGVLTIIGVALISIIVSSIKNWKKMFLTIGVLSLLLVVAFMIFPDVLDTILYRFGIIGDKEISIETFSRQRYEVIVNYWNIITDNGVVSLLFGNGVSNSIESVVVGKYIFEESIIHNFYLSILSKVGIVGFLPLLYLLLIAIRNLFINGNVFAIAFAALLIAGLFTPIQSSEFVWIGLGFALVNKEEV